MHWSSEKHSISSVKYVFSIFNLHFKIADRLYLSKAGCYETHFSIVTAVPVFWILKKKKPDFTDLAIKYKEFRQICGLVLV